MKYSHLLIFSLVAALLIYSCKKKPVPVNENTTPVECSDTNYVENFTYDTVYPSDYLPAYPGSWWEYSDTVNPAVNLNESCDAWIESPVITLGTNCPILALEDRKIIPNTTFGAILNDALITGVSDITKSNFDPILNTSLGRFQDYSKSTYHSSSNQHEVITQTKDVIELLDSMEVNGVMYYDIIHVYTYYSKIHYPFGTGPYWHNDCYFARNVGIIKKEGYRIIDNSTVQHFNYNLLSHYIAPH